MEYPIVLGWVPSGMELVIILLVILLLFGSTRLPQLARGMGKSISEFKKGISEGESEEEREVAEKRREQLRDPELREDELASADRATLNKPR